MPELKPEADKKLRCEHTVGTICCQNCVNEDKCPSNISSIEEINTIEKGQDHCIGQS